MDAKKSSGPDGIHPKLLRKYSSFICKPLYIILTQSFRMGVLPEDWKLADVIPLYKKDSRVPAKNYRPA